jgi:hypothetical protein
MKYLLLILLLSGCTPYEKCDFQNGSRAFLGLRQFDCGPKPIASPTIKPRRGPQKRPRTYGPNHLLQLGQTEVAMKRSEAIDEISKSINMIRFEDMINEAGGASVVSDEEYADMILAKLEALGMNPPNTDWDEYRMQWEEE